MADITTPNNFYQYQILLDFGAGGLTLGCATDWSTTIEREDLTAENACNDNEGKSFQEHTTGKLDASVSLSGLTIYANPISPIELTDAILNDTQCSIVIFLKDKVNPLIAQIGSQIQRFRGKITSVEQSASGNENATYSVTLTPNDTPSPVTPTTVAEQTDFLLYPPVAP